jgi:F0F1-type ATP synthase membrane subunit c/vacuolar-type H+-ATPase subunit K
MILETDYGEGYAPAMEPTVVDIASPALMQAWQDANAAVHQALRDRQQNAPSPLQWTGSLCFVNDEDPRAVPALQKLYFWLAEAPEPSKFGPFMTRGATSPIYLWVFPAQKGVAAGRYPRSDDAPVAGQPVELAPARPGSFWIGAGAAFVIMVLGLFGCGYWIVATCAATIEALAKDPQAKQADLTGQWLISTAIIALMLLLISYAIRGGAFAFLIDERNRMSLSRLQLSAWTILLIGGYWTLAFWDVRCGARGSLMGPFPTMQYDLWLLLGIVNISAVASPLILQTKANADTPATDTAPPHVAATQVSEIGTLDARTTSAGASWLDLFTGEEVANRGTIDISRLQHFVITLLLLATYAYILGATMNGLQVGDPTKPFVAVNMPSVGQTFLGLLAISHAGYLAAKALPKTPANGP